MSDQPPVDLPPKPPVPSTNLLPAVIVVAVLAVACLALALLLPAPRRVVTPEPEQVEEPKPLPLPPVITEYEDPTPATLPAPQIIKPSSDTIVKDTTPPRWQTNAQPLPEIPEGAAKLAIVIDDMGSEDVNTGLAMDLLPPQVTFSFLPYGKQTGTLATLAHQQGHEVMVHIPMEPLQRADTPPEQQPDPGPHALTLDQNTATLQSNLRTNLQGLLSVAVGANNHMGSRFTQWMEGMHVVLTELDARGLFFLDSVTTAHTATGKAADGLNLPLLRRDIFLDDTPEPEAIRRQLNYAIASALKNGQVIAIGHPHPATLEILAEMLPELATNGVTLVPITALIPKP